MRLLVIGMPLPNQKIDNYTFCNAPSFFDYDAMLVEPAAIVQAVEEITAGGASHSTAADEPVVNAPTRGPNVGLADFMHRRREETQRLLDRGGTVAVFARPSYALPFIAGFGGADQYSWLPTPAGVSYGEPFLLPSFGTQVVLSDSSSSVGPFIEGYERWFHYRAYFAENLPAFTAMGHVFARSIGGAAVGVRFDVGRGQILFLPAMFDVPAGDPRFNLATTMLNCLAQSVHAAADEPAPAWTDSVSFPGSEVYEQAVQEAAGRLEAANQAYTEARARLDEVARYRRLLWQEGAYGLEPVVRDAFRVLGFSVTTDPDTPPVLAADDRTAFLEVEGSTDTVVEWPYFRLQKRLEKDLLNTREPKKGIIVVNGQRLLPIDERTQPYTDALRIASENYRYALLTSTALADLVREAQRHPDPAALQRLRDLVFEAVGAQTPEGFPSPSPPAGANDSTEAPPATEATPDGPPP